MTNRKSQTKDDKRLDSIMSDWEGDNLEAELNCRILSLIPQHESVLFQFVGYQETGVLTRENAFLLTAPVTASPGA